MKKSTRKDPSNSVYRIPNYDNVFNNTDKRKTSANSIVFNLFKKSIPTVFLVNFLNVIKTLPVFLIPIVSSTVINEVVSGNPDITKIITIGIILFICIAQNVPSHTLYANVANKFLRKTSAGVKSTVVRKLQKLSINYHKDIESGRLQSKFIKDTDNVDNYLRLILCQIMPAVIFLIINVCISLYQSWIATLFILSIVPISVFLTRLFRNPIRKSIKSYRLENEQLSSKLAQMLDIIQITKAHGLENEEIKIIEEDITKVTKKGLSFDNTLAYFGSFAWAVTTFFQSLCLFFSVFMTINGVPGFNAGAIVLFQSIFSQIYGNISSILNSIPQISQGVDSINSLTEIMSSDDVEDNTGKLKITKIDGNVDFENVYYRYPSTTENVIKNFSLNVKKGECIAFVGSSGSGKSTIMNMIIGFLKPNQGKIYIDGNSIEDINLSDYRQFISVVPQNSILFDGTIRENITYGLTSYTEEQLQRAIKMANVEEFLPELPKGLDTLIGEHGDKISGGQKQRITIARALIRNPSILILDEATSALDNISEFHVQKAIESLVKQRTTFIVAHRLSTIRNADRIVVMENGEMCEIGTYDELMAKQGKFSKLKHLSDIATKELTDE